MDFSPAGPGGPAGVGSSSAHAGSKKRTKIVFLNPTEISNWDQIKGGSDQMLIDQNDLMNYEKLLRTDNIGFHATKRNDDLPKKKRGRPKGSKNGVRKRPVDPTQPWLEPDESDDPDMGLENEIDDDEYFRRLEEEKIREDAEEEFRKRKEMQARAAARANARGRKPGRRGRPKLNSYPNLNFLQSDDGVSNRSRIQRECSRKRGSYASLAGLTEFSDSDDRATPLSGVLAEIEDERESLSDIYGQNEEDDEPESPQRQSVLDLLPPPPTSPSVSTRTDDAISVAGDNNHPNDMSSITSALPSSTDDPHTLHMLEMDPIELRYRAPVLDLPPSANDLVCPRRYLLDALSVYELLRHYGSLLRLSPFRLEDFLACLAANENSNLLAEVHMALMKALLREDDANGITMNPSDSKDSVNLSFYLMDRYNYPYLLANYLYSIKVSEQAANAAASSLIALSLTAATAAGAAGGLTGAGGADIVLTASLFPPDLIPLDSDYPFVSIDKRIAVLRGLMNLFLATGPVRGDILREGFLPHEDYCRVCHQSGEVLCCDGCTAVFHLHCLKPPLSVVPTTSWICPVCLMNKTTGVTDCLSDAERIRISHRQEQIGRDRAGRIYWYISRRLVVEPVDFSQVEPELMNFQFGIKDDNWEAEFGDELIQTIGQDTDNDNDNNVSQVSDPNERIDNRSSHKFPTNPLVDYANEPAVYYYSSVEQVLSLRKRLSSDWEPWLCQRLDALLPRITLEMGLTQKLTQIGLHQFRQLKSVISDQNVEYKVLNLNTNTSYNNNNNNNSYTIQTYLDNVVHIFSVFEYEQIAALTNYNHSMNDDRTSNCNIMEAMKLTPLVLSTLPSLPVDFVIHHLESAADEKPTPLITVQQQFCLVKNYDQILKSIKMTDKTSFSDYAPTVLRPYELSSLNVDNLLTILQQNNSNAGNNLTNLLAYRLSDEGDWRSWTNIYTTGVWSTNAVGNDTTNTQNNSTQKDPVNKFVNQFKHPTDRATDMVDVTDGVNIALTRVQYSEEKERRRLLANKFNLSDFSFNLWQFIDSNYLVNVLKQLQCSLQLNKNNDKLVQMINCWTCYPSQLFQLAKLTICYMEAQIPLAFFTPAWRMHRLNWIKQVLNAESVSALSLLLARLEVCIRAICFQRAWFSSLGHLSLERLTAAQREEDKRLRQYDRIGSGVSTSTAVANASSMSLSLIRTKTPRPIRHTVWKTRGEEYRRLGGDGWMWLSSSRRKTSSIVREDLKVKPQIAQLRRLHEQITSTEHGNVGSGSRPSGRRRTDTRGLQHGIGWAVCPEYLQGQNPVRTPKPSECRGHILHPITGIPLYLNVRRLSYIIPANVLCDLQKHILKERTQQQANESRISSEEPVVKTEAVVQGMDNIVKATEAIQSDEFTGHKVVNWTDSQHLKDCKLSNTTKIEQSTVGSDNIFKVEQDEIRPVLNISYCLTHRLHFPPAIEQPSTESNHRQLSRRSNCSLDDLLYHRQRLAESAYRIGQLATEQLTELQCELDHLTQQHKCKLKQLAELLCQAQSARTRKNRALKAKQSALINANNITNKSVNLSTPVHTRSSINNPHIDGFTNQTVSIDENNNDTTSTNTNTNSVIYSTDINTVNTTTINTKQLIQQSVLSDNGIRYRVLAPKTISPVFGNAQQHVALLRPSSTVTSQTTTSSRGDYDSQKVLYSQRRRRRQPTESSSSNSDNSDMDVVGKQSHTEQGLQLRRSSRKQRATRPDPDFVVDFDDDEDVDAGVASDDSESCEPQNATFHNNQAAHIRPPNYQHFKRGTYNVMSNYTTFNKQMNYINIIPQFDGTGDSSDSGTSVQIDEIVMRSRLPQWREVKRPRLDSDTPTLTTLNNDDNRRQGSLQPLKLKNIQPKLSVKHTAIHSQAISTVVSGTLSSQAAATTTNVVSECQPLRLVRVLRSADGATSVVPISSKLPILPESARSIPHQMMSHKLPLPIVSSSSTSMDGLRLVLTPTATITNTTASQCTGDITTTTSTATVANGTKMTEKKVTVSGSQTVELDGSKTTSSSYVKLANLINSVGSVNKMQSSPDAGINSKTPVSASNILRFVVTPMSVTPSQSSVSETPATARTLSDCTNGDVDNTTLSSATTNLPLILPRKPPAILRRTLANNKPSNLLISSNFQSSGLNVASLVATNTARKLVCGTTNRVIAPAPNMDTPQGRRSLAKAEHTRNTVPLGNDQCNMLATPVASSYTTCNTIGPISSVAKGLSNQANILISSTTDTQMMQSSSSMIQQQQEFLLLDQEISDAVKEIETVDKQIADLRIEIEDLERQLKTTKSKLSYHQHLIDQMDPPTNLPYSLQLSSSNSTVVDIGGQNLATNQRVPLPLPDGNQLITLPTLLPPVNLYCWPNSSTPGSNLFKLDRRNLRPLILCAGRRELPGYDTEKKRLTQVNWPYPTSRPSFAECWRFRLSQLRINPSSMCTFISQRSFGQNLADLLLLLRVLWHNIRWDDLLSEPSTDAFVLDGAGKPCYCEEGVSDVVDDDDVADDTGQAKLPCTVRRIVEIQPLDRFWLRANYRVQITTNRPKRTSSLTRTRKSRTSAIDSRLKPPKHGSPQPNPEESGQRRRRGRRPGQKVDRVGKDPDYNPAADEGWRVGIPCSATALRRQSRQFGSGGRNANGANSTSTYDCDDNDDDDDDNDGFMDTNLDDVETDVNCLTDDQNKNVLVEEKLVSEGGLNLWEIRVFMNTFLPPKSDYPTEVVNLHKTSDLVEQPCISNVGHERRFYIPRRLASVPLPYSSGHCVHGETVTGQVDTISSQKLAVMERYVDLEEKFTTGSTSKTTRRSALASALSSNAQDYYSTKSQSTTTSTASSKTQSQCADNRQQLTNAAGTNNNSSNRNLNASPNTLEAKARARSLAASHAARASVAARKARAERALLEQRVRLLKSQFNARRRSYFSWAKVAAELSLSDYKQAQLKQKSINSNQKSSVSSGKVVKAGRPVGRPRKLAQKAYGTKLKPTQKVRRHFRSTFDEDDGDGDNDDDLEYEDNIVDDFGDDEDVDDGATTDGVDDNSTELSLSLGEDTEINFDSFDDERENEPNWTPTTSHRGGRSTRKATNSKSANAALKSVQSKMNSEVLVTKHRNSTSTVHKSSTATTTLAIAKERHVRGIANKSNHLNKSGDLSTPSTSPGVDDHGVVDKRKFTPKTNKQKLPNVKRSQLSTTKSTTRLYKHSKQSTTPPVKHGRVATVTPSGRGRARLHSATNPDIINKTGTMEAVTASSEALYCICKTEYDPSREYIGCDLCQDWFHFECVSLQAKDADKLGDSWHCPDCKQAELNANEMLYCVCRTPYEQTRVYIACDGCDEWYHPECVDLTPEEAANHIGTYICPLCRKADLPNASHLTSNHVRNQSNIRTKSKPTVVTDSTKELVGTAGQQKTIFETVLTTKSTNKLLKLMEDLKTHKMSWPFISSPDPSKYPIVNSNMLADLLNLTTIIKNLKCSAYHTLGDFSFDMSRLFAQARLIYVKGTPEFHCTDVLEAQFVRQMKAFKKQL